MTEAIQSLFKLRIFKLALWLPIVVAICISIYIVFTSSLEWKSGFDGINSLIVIFKVPIGIAAISFPLVALITANHRSIQSKKQIEVAELQNQFSNYFKHLEEFEKHVSKLKLDNSKLSIESVRMLHGSLFSTFKNFHYEFPKIIKEEFLETSKEIYKELYQIKNNRYYLTKDKALNLMKKVNWLNDTFYLNKFNDYDVGNHSQINSISYYVPKTYRDLFSLFKNRILIVMHILEFSYTEKFPDYLKALQSLDINWTDEIFIEFLEEETRPAEILQLFLSDCGADGDGEIMPEKDGLYGKFSAEEPPRN